jgi:hypothetical protein
MEMGGGGEGVTAYITHLRLEDKSLPPASRSCSCYVFDWSVHSSHFAVDAKLVREALKREVPAADRGWDPDGKRWYVKVEYRGTLAKLFSNFEGALEALEKQPALF